MPTQWAPFVMVTSTCHFGTGCWFLSWLLCLGTKLLFPCVTVQGHKYNYEGCALPETPVYANVSVFNKQRWYNVTSMANPGFAGLLTGKPSSIDDDYALLPSSTLYAINPNFKSCPRSATGPTVIAPGTILPLYLQYFNIPQPARFTDMMNFAFSKILNQTLRVPNDTFIINNDTTLVIPY